VTAPDIAALAKSLTEAQRAAMLSARWIHPGGQDPICLVEFSDPWTAPVAQFFTLTVDRLTPLGLAVRQHLAGAK
jgi:hypothetical protein